MKCISVQLFGLSLVMLTVGELLSGNRSPFVAVAMITGLMIVFFGMFIQLCQSHD